MHFSRKFTGSDRGVGPDNGDVSMASGLFHQHDKGLLVFTPGLPDSPSHEIPVNGFLEMPFRHRDEYSYGVKPFNGRSKTADYPQ